MKRATEALSAIRELDPELTINFCVGHSDPHIELEFTRREDRKEFRELLDPSKTLDAAIVGLIGRAMGYFQPYRDVQQ